MSARPLNVGVFDGSLSANADVVLGDVPAFNATLAMRSLNMEQALHSQNIDAAGRVRGLLTGNVAATGSGADWHRIRPTLRGSGRVAIANGKLMGVNIVADALNAVAAAPGVSQLVNVAFMSSHHGLLVDPNTELQAASMSFQQVGPRFTTHDLFAQSPDYAITGDGWFDMDKNIEMNADIKVALGLQVAIPVTVSGQLPGVRVLPDVPTLAERVAMGAINTPGNIIRGGVNAVGSIVGAPSAWICDPVDSEPDQRAQEIPAVTFRSRGLAIEQAQGADDPDDRHDAKITPGNSERKQCWHIVSTSVSRPGISKPRIAAICFSVSIEVINFTSPKTN